MKTSLPVWLRRFLIIIAIGLVGYGTSKIGVPEHASPKGSVEVSREATATATFVPETTGKVTYVFDGDTIELSDGIRVRYIGVNTPEMARENVKAECFSKEASDENKILVLGKTVRLVADVSDKDTYGRLLRYVYVAPPRVDDASSRVEAGDIFINDYLVRQGFARAEPVKPDIHYAPQFLAAQQEARKFARGLWARCAVDSEGRN